MGAQLGFCACETSYVERTIEVAEARQVFN